MAQIHVTFTDGSVERFDETATFNLYKEFTSSWEPKSSFIDVRNTVSLSSRPTKKLSVVFLNVLCDTQFFQHVETGVIYATKHVVKIVDC